MHRYDGRISGRRSPTQQLQSPVKPLKAIEKGLSPAVERVAVERVDALRNYFTDVLQISRVPVSETIVLGTSPTLILKPPHQWPYLIYNPVPILNLTESTVIHASGTETVDGNSQATPLGVANFLQAHFFLDVTSITNAWDFILQTKDPLSGKWVDSQLLFGGINNSGTYYQPVGTNGIVKDIAIRWSPLVGSSSVTFSFGVTLKEGQPGFSDGQERTIYIGGKNVNSNNGIPVFEGKDRLMFLEQQVELYAVANDTINLKIFSM